MLHGSIYNHRFFSVYYTPPKLVGARASWTYVLSGLARRASYSSEEAASTAQYGIIVVETTCFL
jgi:hypothetical protein